MSGASGALFAVLVSNLARAEPTAPEKAAGTVLFREARGLMDRGEIAAACRRFEESERLDPLPGTLLNMAVCHEKEGRTATAWVEFRDAAALARRDGRDDRVALAEEHEKGLEPRLLRVRVVVPAEADVPKLTIAVDGVELARIAWDTPLPLDPGDHVVVASAPAKVARSVHVTLAQAGETQVVTVQRLDDAPAEPPPVPAPLAAAPAPLPTAPAANSAPAQQVKSEASGLGAQREVALVLVGLAVVGLGVGTYFGLDAFAKHADSNGQCPTPNQCSALGVTYNNESMTSADRSTVVFGASIAVLGTAAVLWFTGGRSPRARSTAIRLVPMGGREGAGFAVTGTF